MNDVVSAAIATSVALTSGKQAMLEIAYLIRQFCIHLIGISSSSNHDLFNQI